jgi:hypothetical protein
MAAWMATDNTLNGVIDGIRIPRSLPRANIYSLRTGSRISPKTRAYSYPIYRTAPRSTESLFHHSGQFCDNPTCEWVWQNFYYLIRNDSDIDISDAALASSTDAT